MRTIERSTAFKRDYKRTKKVPKYMKKIDSLLQEALLLLVGDKELPDSMLDHSLTGNWGGYRECHLKPDLLLIYKKVGTETLRLARLGSHSDLFS